MSQVVIEDPVLNSPLIEPKRHFRCGDEGITDEVVEERRASTYFVPNAWIDENTRDAKDGQVGIVGYEIPLTWHFCEYKPPRPLEEIEADIKAIEKDIVRMLAEVTA